VTWADRPGEADNEAFLADPEVDLSRDTSITLDANAARSLDVGTASPTEDLTTTLTDWRIPAGSTTPYGVVTGELPYQVHPWATPTAPVAVGRFLFEHNHLLGTPVITAEVPAHGRLPALTLHPRYQHYSAFIPKLDGQLNLPVVDVGTGSAAQFARVDVRGKVALIDIGDQTLAPLFGTDFASAQLQNAADAGAAAVFAYGNAGMPVLGSVPMPHSAYPLPTVALPAADGAALHERLASAPATLRIDSQPSIPDVYSLSYLEQGSIPAAPPLRVNDRALATVRESVHSDRPVSVSESWAPRRPAVFQPDDFAASYAALSLDDTPGPARRTEHIGPVSSAAWGRSVTMHDLDAMLRIDEGHTTSSLLGSTFNWDVFDRPTDREEDWGEAPTVPGQWAPATSVTEQTPANGRPECAACRFSGLLPDADMLPLLTTSVDAADHYGELTSYSNGQPIIPGSSGVDEWHLYSGGAELPQQSLVGVPGLFPYYAMPPGLADYRLTEHFIDGYPRGGYGTRADTTWTFHSQSPTGKQIPSSYDGLNICVSTCGAVPLLFLRYNLGLSADNRLSAPGQHAVTITAYSPPSTVAMPRAAGMTVQASFDGGVHWSRMSAVPLGGGSYRVVLVHPPLSATTGTVSLKATAWDAAGNRVEQVLRDAYGLAGR
jgi:hypothetical protein